MMRGAWILLLCFGITAGCSGGGCADAVKPHGVSLLALKVTPTRAIVGPVEEQLGLPQEVAAASRASNSTYHANASSHYSSRLATAENDTLCRECAEAEEDLLAAFRAARQEHILAQEQAVALAEAVHGHTVAGAEFSSHREAYEVIKNSLEQRSMPPYDASTTEFTDLIDQARELQAMAQTVTQAETDMTGNRTVMDLAQTAYDEAASMARLADDEVTEKEQAKEVACASRGLPAPAPPSPANHSLSAAELGSVQCTGNMQFTLTASSWLPVSPGASYCDVTLAENFDRVIEASYEVYCVPNQHEHYYPEDDRPMLDWLSTVGQSGYFSFGTPETILDVGGTNGGGVWRGGRHEFVVGDVQPGNVLRFGFYQDKPFDMFEIRDIQVKVRSIG